MVKPVLLLKINYVVFGFLLLKIIPKDSHLTPKHSHLSSHASLSGIKLFASLKLTLSKILNIPHSLYLTLTVSPKGGAK